MVCDTCLDGNQYSSVGQWYQDISAESRQITKLKRIIGKPVCCDSGIQKLAAQTWDAEISTTKGDWVTSRSRAEVGQRRSVHQNCVLRGHL